MRAIIVGAVLLLLSHWPVAAQTPDKVHFLMDWLPTGEHAAYYGGWQHGIFAAHGIDVTITRGYGAGDTVSKVAAGAAQFGVADLAAVMTARARGGAPVKTIMAIYTASPHSLFVLKSSGITTFKGLEGKKSPSPRATATSCTFPRWPGAPARIPTRSSGSTPMRRPWRRC